MRMPEKWDSSQILRLPRPSEKQREFFLAREPMVAFGGARGGGKSWAVRIKAVLLCLNYPGIKTMIVRKTYPELQENHILPLLSLLGWGSGRSVVRYSDSKKHILFPNGSRILFRYCDTDADAQRFQGTEVDVLFLDEATQQPEETVRQLTACVRGTGDYPRRVYLTCNPGGPGHGWVKRLFIDRQYRPGENPGDYRFIRSLITDNRVLLEKDPGYLARLEALPVRLRRAWLEGDWNIFEGQFFREFRDDPAHYGDRLHTHVIDPFEIPKSWKLYRSFDWGYAKPFSCGWWAVDGEGRLYRILELYGCTEPDRGVQWDPDRVFSRIRGIETEHRWLRDKTITGIADPAIFEGQTGESIAQRAAKHQVYFSPGDHKRIPGWMQVHYRLAFDAEGRPGMYFFRNCADTIRTLPALCFDKYRPEDLDTRGEDHAADEIRYLCMARPVTPVQAPEGKGAPHFLDPGFTAPARQRMEIME